MAVHNEAAMVIGRRSYEFKESVPQMLIDKYIEEENKNKFNQSNEWKKWSMIDKNIKKKGEVTKPDFWIVNRKRLLGLSG